MSKKECVRTRTKFLNKILQNGIRVLKDCNDKNKMKDFVNYYYTLTDCELKPASLDNYDIEELRSITSALLKEMINRVSCYKMSNGENIPYTKIEVKHVRIAIDMLR